MITKRLSQEGRFYLWENSSIIQVQDLIDKLEVRQVVEIK